MFLPKLYNNVFAGVLKFKKPDSESVAYSASLTVVLVSVDPGCKFQLEDTVIFPLDFGLRFSE